MNLQSGNLLRTIVLYLLMPFAAVKLLYSIAGYLYLAKDDVTPPATRNLSYHYSLDLASKILPFKTKSAPVKQIEANDRIKDITLKGTYLDDVNSFIVIEDQLGTTFLYKGDRYMGYVLKEIYDNRAVFEKNGKHYDLVIEEKSGKSKKGAARSETASRYTGGTGGEESFAPVSVTHEEVQSYIKNPNKIWRNIRIQEMRKNGQIEGFRVNYVKKGSFFDQAGLKSGDVIKAIDGSEIRTLSDVMRYYNNINNLDGLTLTVMRGGQEIDLEFNIN
ncbi:MAG TPA: PDZ domain-containing protein [Campylobacteraceae bacterium]|nr:PDZ domain-containing protein [Campylobacteraceae bacterium]